MRPLILVSALLLAACTDVETPTEDNDQEIITTVELTIDNVVHTWADPEGDGDPVIDPILLQIGDHTASVRFLNELENPPEDITPEVLSEAEEHQVFWETDTDASFTVGDQDANGLPLGLEGNLFGNAVGTGSLTITLRHLPEEGGIAVKVAGLEDTVATDGIEAIPGDSDARVTFPLEFEE